MTTVLALSGSPSGTSRTAAASVSALDRLGERGFTVRHVAARDLPAEDLLAARTANPRIRRVLAELEQADGVIVATPVYKASYTGLIKVLLDLLPQDGLAGKTVLPMATGGTIAHLLAMDYGLRPVLCALGARHIVAATFLLDSAFVTAPDGAGYSLAHDADLRLTEAIDQFAAALPAPALPSALAPVA